MPTLLLYKLTLHSRFPFSPLEQHIIGYFLLWLFFKGLGEGGVSSTNVTRWSINVFTNMYCYTTNAYCEKLICMRSIWLGYRILYVNVRIFSILTAFFCYDRVHMVHTVHIVFYCSTSTIKSVKWNHERNLYFKLNWDRTRLSLTKMKPRFN